MICITGHKGFVGSAFCDALSVTDSDYFGIDLKEDWDIRDVKPSDLRGVDYIVHFAALPRVQYSIEHPIETHQHNVEGTLNLLECARQAGVKRVIFSSSSAVYGDQIEEVLTEEMIPEPMSPYAIHKLIGEQYCKLYYTLYGLESVCLRYFNIYGEDAPLEGQYSQAIATFLNQRQNDLPLTVFGGRQTRDFVYIGDVIRAIMKAIDSPKVGCAEIINIGSGQQYSIDDVALAISDDIQHLPQKQGEPMHTLADITLAKEYLGWQPEQDLIKWLKRQ